MFVTNMQYCFLSLDFTFVCPSEIIAHSHRAKDFQQRNVEVTGVSVDSHFTHYAWRNTPITQGGEVMNIYGVSS